jgi:hypothetical protein
MSTNRTEPTTHTALYQKTLGVLIWVAFGAVGVGVLYWFSILSGDKRQWILLKDIWGFRPITATSHLNFCC